MTTLGMSGDFDPIAHDSGFEAPTGAEQITSPEPAANTADSVVVDEIELCYRMQHRGSDDTVLDQMLRETNVSGRMVPMRFHKRLTQS